MAASSAGITAPSIHGQRRTSETSSAVGGFDVTGCVVVGEGLAGGHRAAHARTIAHGGENSCIVADLPHTCQSVWAHLLHSGRQRSAASPFPRQPSIGVAASATGRRWSFHCMTNQTEFTGLGLAAPLLR